ncbi:hypothetical protein C0J52_06967 [Blattella germanica]|nr:hypothetical protein C0J52_06967 [Blattella germanica]
MLQLATHTVLPPPFESRANNFLNRIRRYQVNSSLNRWQKRANISFPVNETTGDDVTKQASAKETLDDVIKLDSHADQVVSRTETEVCSASPQCDDHQRVVPSIEREFVRLDTSAKRRLIPSHNNQSAYLKVFICKTNKMKINVLSMGYRVVCKTLSS